MRVESEASLEPITVISVWHDRVQTVESSLRSILSQEGIDARFLIIDDGSVDGTTEALQKTCADFPTREITFVQQRNEGFTRTIQRWTSEISTPYFALHGAGDLSAPTRIAQQLRHAKESGAVVVGCGVGFTNSDGGCSELKRLPRNVPQGSASPHRPPRPGTHGAALIHTDTFHASGGYRTEFRYSQDADLWFRMSALGDFDGVPSLLYWKYTGVGETVSSNPEKRYAQALYGELARQCEEDRARGRPDMVERFGHDAVLFLRDTERLRRRIISSGMQSMDIAMIHRVLDEPTSARVRVRGRVRAGIRTLIGKFS